MEFMFVHCEYNKVKKTDVTFKVSTCIIGIILKVEGVIQRGNIDIVIKNSLL